MAIFFLSWPKAEYLPTIEKRPWKELDPVSTTLLIAASVLFVFPFQNAGEEGDIWSHAVFIAPLVAGIVCWIALFGWEYVAEKRCGDKLATAFPLRLMRNRVYAAAAVNMILVGFPFLLVIFAFPLRLQVVSGKDPLLAGVMLLPMLGAAAIGAVAGGMINGSKNHMFGTLLAAACIVLLGSGLMSTLSYSVNVEAKSLGFIATIGFGFGLSTSSSTILAVYESSIRDHGKSTTARSFCYGHSTPTDTASAPAQGILAQARILGGSIGIAASSAILGVTLRSQLEGVLTLEQGESLRGPNANLTEVQLAAVRHAFADAFTKDMHVSAVVAGVAVLLVFGTYRKKPLSMEARRAQQTQEEIDRRKNRRGHQVNLATSSSD